ncbi:hypothetical protein GTW43_33800 [Streptomyces sp. SID5785]|uniref:DUF6571 family protein n=1 Tax=Streptomyces sp. SID5785 TaxID=2690309 RepID=UPI001361211A|nr:DUF6571 family protein [Streptomyces sp. SID5785]MZD10019.1 hypothetical protein [Streptomyces sp. SID5785]
MDFETLHFGNFAALETAVHDWSGMVKKLKTLETQASRGLKGRAEKANWSGVNATVSREFIKKTAQEFADAHTQATTIRNILRDTRGELIKHRDDLKAALQRGRKKNLTVRDTGKGGFSVEMIVHPDRAAKGTDVPDHTPEDLESLRDELQRILNAATESDTTADRVLREIANMADKGFSGVSYKDRDSAVSDMRDAEAEYAAKLAKEITGDGGTARHYEELKKLEHLIDINSESPEFSADFYKKLGPDGTLDFYTKMSLNSTALVGPEAAGRTTLVHHIQDDMGNMLGLATNSGTAKHPNPYYLGDRWTTQLMRAGREEVDVSRFAGVGTKVYGYQALGSIIRHGEYDKDFLTSVARDMVAMDKENPDVWRENAPLDQNLAFNLDKTGGKGFYPLTGMLEAMSNNPDAATQFFNEGVREDSNKDGIVTLADDTVKGSHGRAQGMVDYFLDQKETSDWFDLRTGEKAEAVPAKHALGPALEAAVSGQANPQESGYTDRQPHTKQMTDVFERIVDKVGGEPDLMTSTLSGSMGRMSAEYIQDINANLGGDLDDIEKGGARYDGQSHAHLDKNKEQFLDAIGRHKESYETLSSAQHEFTQGSMQYAVEHTPVKDGDLRAALSHIAHTDGKLNGILAGGQIDSALEEQKDANDEYNRNLDRGAASGSFAAGMVFEAAATRAPIAGELAGWAFDSVLAEEIEDAKKDPYEGAADHVRAAYQSSLGDHTLNPLKAQLDNLTFPKGTDSDIYEDAVLDESENGYSNGLTMQQNVGTNHATK